MHSVRMSRAVPGAAAVLAAGALIAAGLHLEVLTVTRVFGLFAALLIVCACGWLVWNVEPAYIFCGALLVSPMSGNWPRLGVPGLLAPDRLLLFAAIGAVLFKTAASRDRPEIKIGPVHWLMLVTALYAVVSALFSGAFFLNGPAFKLVETFGLAPFLVFVAAPVAFRTERARNALLGTFVALGVYLGLTALFETIHLRALVFPKYILDPSYGIHYGRARGPFVEAVMNGFALYVCAVASAIAWWRWRGRRYLPTIAAATVVLCLAGAFMSTQRSVWLGAGIATVAAAIAIGGAARRYVVLIAVALAVAIGGSMLLIPGFAAKVQERSNDQHSVWDRKNLNRAAYNMIVARPLFGFGWGNFLVYDKNYFQQSRDYPLTKVWRLPIHSTILTYGVELGLVGLLLWLATLVTAVGGALGTRGPPDLRGWRIGLLAVAICFMIVTNFVPPYTFPNLCIWLWVAVAWSGRYAVAEAGSRARA